MTALGYQRPFSPTQVGKFAAVYDPARIGGTVLNRVRVGDPTDKSWTALLGTSAYANGVTSTVSGETRFSMPVAINDGIRFGFTVHGRDDNIPQPWGFFHDFGPAFRMQDANNFWFVQFSQTNTASQAGASLAKWVGGTLVGYYNSSWQLSGAQNAFVSRVKPGDRIELEVSNGRVDVFHNQVKQLTFDGWDDGYLSTVATVGFRTGVANRQFSDWQVATATPSDGDTVALLPDLSGHGRHLVQLDPAKRPVFLATTAGREWLPVGDRADWTGGGTTGNWQLIRGTSLYRDGSALHNGKVSMHAEDSSTHQPAILWGGGGTDLIVPPGNYILRFSAMGDVAGGLTVTSRGEFISELDAALTSVWQDFAAPITVGLSGVVTPEIQSNTGHLLVAGLSLRPANPPLPNGQPVLDFDGMDDCMSVAGWDTPDALSIATATCHNGPSRGFRQWLARMDQAFESSWIVTQNGTEEYFDVRSHVAYTTHARGAWHTKAFIASSGVGHEWVDGVVAPPDSLAGPGTYANVGAVTPASYPLWVGATPFSGSEAMSLGLLVLADRQFSDAERTFLQAGLKARFGTP